MKWTEPRYWKLLQRHPLSQDYEDIDRAQMLADLKEFGNVDDRRISVALDEADDTWKVIDGWQFYQCHIELGTRPDFRPVNNRIPQDVFVRIKNDNRRHETPEAREQRIEARRVRVEALRKAGESLRAIAEAEGVDDKTVRNDLAAVSGAEGSAPDPQKTRETEGSDGSGELSTVTGRDGKSYPAGKPKVLCDRCQRVGETKNCPMCAEARKAAKKGTAKPAPKKKDEGPSEVKDHFGNPVPKRCLDVWCDPWIQDTLNFLERTSEDFRKRRVADSMKKREKRLPFFKAADVIDGSGFVIDYLDKLITHFKEQRPSGVCPMCQGAGCLECLRSGLVPHEFYKGLKKSAKECADDTHA